MARPALESMFEAAATPSPASAIRCAGKTLTPCESEGTAKNTAGRTSNASLLAANAATKTASSGPENNPARNGRTELTCKKGTRPDTPAEAPKNKAKNGFNAPPNPSQATATGHSSPRRQNARLRPTETVLMA
ncbi:hypothetical protein AUJ14_01745 [Candidatus Micrarchaeota archaeon CG1_02_55_22]|nr:MAG: hypothetical protein AUJ14_01745 [Candidatus Micrarchaeota archaeon CG1_02_55_22]